MLLGEVKPNIGRIIYKDVRGKAITPNPEEIGYIAQDNTLFPETIENNITMFDSKLNKQVDQILENVELKKDIEKFPAGMETIVDLEDVYKRQMHLRVLSHGKISSKLKINRLV